MNPSDPLQNAAADARLNQVLAHLDSAQPPAGLNGRLLKCLQIHAAAQARPSRLAYLVSFAGVSSKAVWALGLVCAFVLALAILGLPPTHTKSHAPAGRPGLVLMTQAAPPIPARAAPVQITRIPASSAAAQPKSARNPVRREEGLPAGPEEAQALDDLHAPSQPAPPMPLTAQERLLTRMLRKDNGQQLAQLAPEPAPIFPGGEKAAFKRFFDPPPVPQPEDPSSTPPSAPSLSPSQGKLQ